MGDNQSQNANEIRAPVLGDVIEPTLEIDVEVVFLTVGLRDGMKMREPTLKLLELVFDFRGSLLNYFSIKCVYMRSVYLADIPNLDNADEGCFQW